MKETVRFEINGRPVSLDVDPERMLLWVLRTELGLTGTKYGCGEGYCGVCTVLVDGEPTKSCSTSVKTVNSRSVVTIEGLASEGRLHPLQEAFIRHNVMQCGFCTPGMILTAAGFLRKNPRPTRDEILGAMEDNLCRCGGYMRIIQAVETAAREMGKGGGR
ncbi:MAG: (2Fe-2S)-binding protein [Candidatus Aminicenantes bacterium]|nr:(2Fe-2S)-binding protein [Candidatus Aminicenantes bacterium]